MFLPIALVVGAVLALAFVLAPLLRSEADVNYPTLLPRRIRASVLEGGALMWTPGNQSPAIGR
jgi:hypothetical protein